MSCEITYYNEETHPDQKYFLSHDCQHMLNDIHPALAEVVRRAQAISDVQIQVIHGKRTQTQQEEFYRKGVTQGAISPHSYGSAVDLLPVIKGRLCPEIEAMDEIAMCMKYASADLNTPIRWGGAWHCQNLSTYEGMVEDLQNWYLQHCVEEGIRPQLDTHHFELSVAE